MATLPRILPEYPINHIQFISSQFNTDADHTKTFSINGLNSTVWDTSKTFYFNDGIITSSDSHDISRDGTKLYIHTDGTISEYNLSTPWDPSTAVLHQRNAVLSTDARGIHFSTDGLKLLTGHQGLGTSYFHVYNLSTAWDSSTATSAGAAGQLDVHSVDARIRGVCWSEDGTKAFFTGIDSGAVFGYSLSTAWDISTGTRDTAFLDLDNYNTQYSKTINSVRWMLGGTRLLVSDDSGDRIYFFEASTPHLLSASNITYLGYTSCLDSAPSLCVSDDETNVFFTAGPGQDSVFYHPMPTGVVPEDFRAITALNVTNGRADLNGSPDATLPDTYELEARIVTGDGATVLAAGDATGAFQFIANINTDGYIDFGPVAFSYVNTAATKEQWLTAKLEAHQDYTATGLGDGLRIALNYIEFGGTYDAVGPRSIPVGQALETSTASVVLSPDVIGQAAETDVALAVTVDKEEVSNWSDSVSVSTGAKTIAVIQAVETDAAKVVSRAKRRSVGQAAGINAALLIGSGKAVHVGVSPSTTTAQAITPARAVAVGQAAEASSTTAVGSTKALVVGQALELDQGGDATHLFGRFLTHASETDEATPVQRLKVRAAGQTAETELAQPVYPSVGEQVVVVGQAVEVSASTPVVIYYTKTATLVATSSTNTGDLVNESGGTSSLHLSLDDDPNSSDGDTTFVARASRTDTIAELRLEIGKVLPANFWQMSSMSATISARIIGLRVDDTVGVYSIVRGTHDGVPDTDLTVVEALYRASESGSGTSYSTKTVQYSLTDSGVSADDVDWKTAYDRVHWSYTQGGLTSDDVDVRLSAIRYDITYLARANRMIPVGQAVESSTAGAAESAPTRLVSQAQEAEQAQPVSVPKTRLVDQAVESDLGMPAGFNSSLPVTHGTENDTALGVKAAKAAGVGQASSGESSLSLSSSKVRAVGQAVEISSSLGVARKKKAYPGQASEVSAALSVAPNENHPVLQAQESDQARPITRLKRERLRQVTEFDSGFSATPLRTVAVGQAAEVGSAPAVGIPPTRLVRQASELDVSRPVVKTGAKVVEQAEEVSQSLSIGSAKVKAVGTSSETSSATAVQPHEVHSVPLVSESSSALAISGAKAVHVGQAAESSAAFAVAANEFHPVSMASESSSAHAIGSLKVRSVGQAVESATSGVVTPHRAVALGQASETSQSGDVQIPRTRLVKQAAELDSSRPITKTGAKVADFAVETSTALPVGSAKVKALGFAQATEFGLSVTAHEARTVGQASEAEVAQTAQPSKGVDVGQAAESSQALQVSSAEVHSVGQAVEIQAAGAVGLARAYGVARANESDLSLVVKVDRAITALQAGEASFARPLRAIKTVEVGLAQEAGTPLPLGSAKTYDLTHAAETSQAQAATVRRSVAVGQATETSSSLPLLVARARNVGQAVETDTALTSSVLTPSERFIGVLQVIESETALGVEAPRTRIIGLSSETYTVGSATPKKTVRAGQAAEGSTATTIVRAKLRGVLQVSESYGVSDVTKIKSRTLRQPGEFDLPTRIRAIKRLKISTALESDQAFGIVSDYRTARPPLAGGAVSVINGASIVAGETSGTVQAGSERGATIATTSTAATLTPGSTGVEVDDSPSSGVLI